MIVLGVDFGDEVGVYGGVEFWGWVDLFGV